MPAGYTRNGVLIKGPQDLKMVSPLRNATSGSSTTSGFTSFHQQGQVSTTKGFHFKGKVPYLTWGERPQSF